MNTFCFIATLLTVAFGSLAQPLENSTPWTGPIADHILGVLPHETPEVVAAKKYHFEAYQKAYNSLPKLPLEDETAEHLDPSRPTYDHTYQNPPEYNILTPNHQLHREPPLVTYPQQLDPEVRPWTGPIADHKLGVLPEDTSEVKAARTQHLEAYRSAYNSLPAVPLEANRDLVRTPLNRQLHRNLPGESIDKLVLDTAELQSTPRSLLLAEAIPRSPIGEVPEVHFARIAHLKALEEAKALLPSLDQSKLK